MLKRVFISFCLISLTSCIFMPDDFSNSFTKHTQYNKAYALFEQADYNHAMQELAPLAEKGDMDSQYMIGLIHLYGLAGPKNASLARDWFTQAANQGSKAAQVQLGLLYNDSMSPLYNQVHAYYWLQNVVEDYPEYEQTLSQIETSLYRRGVLSQVQKAPKPKDKNYTGKDYNGLFLLR